MKKSLKIILLLILVFFVLLVLLFQISKARNFQFFGEIFARVETPQKFVALTFDDGPRNPQTDEILQILREENVKATFYLMGAEIKENPAELVKIINEGHEIGNHSYSHERMFLVSPSFVKREFEETDNLIRQANYTKEITFRPPFGKKLFVLPWYLSQTHRKTITWDVEPETYVQTSDELIKYTTENTKNGSIILMHVMYGSRRESMKAVRPIIKNLRERGFEFKTVSELIALNS